MDLRPLFLFIIGLMPSLLIGQQGIAESYIYHSGELTIISNEERTEGVHYKVEVVRLASFNTDDPELDRLKNYGDIYTETLDNLGQTSLLIGKYDTVQKARKIKDQLKDLGFTETNIITYKNGLRQSP